MYNFCLIFNHFVPFPLSTFSFFLNARKNNSSQLSLNPILIINPSHRWDIILRTTCSWPFAEICLPKETTILLINLLYPFIQFFTLITTLSSQVQQLFETNRQSNGNKWTDISELKWASNTLESAARRTVPSSLIKGCWIFTSIPGSRRPADLFKSVRHLMINSIFH